MESDEIASFIFKPSDGQSVPTFLPGQYTSLRVVTPEGTTQRNYTLSNAPGNNFFRITVKLHGPACPGAPPGGVSTYLHTSLKVGDELLMGIPCGAFVLQPIVDTKPIVLISGGVGITPLLAMLEHLISQNVRNKIVMINTSKSPQVEAMHGLLAKYRRKHLNLVIKTLYDEGAEDYPQGPITMDHLDQVLMTRDAHYYFCGPPGFMQTIYTGLHDWGIPSTQVHYEFFGPHDELL